MGGHESSQSDTHYLFYATTFLVACCEEDIPSEVLARVPIEAACNGHLKALVLYCNHPKISHTLNVNKLLVNTIRRGRSDVTVYLLSRQNICVNTDPNFFYGPLHRSLTPANILPFLMLLNQENIDVNQLTRKNDNVFTLACENGRPDIISILLTGPHKNKVNTKQYDQDHQTASHKACWSGNIEVIKLLLEHNCFDAYKKCYSSSKSKYTPVDLACIAGNFNVVNYVFDNLSSFYPNGTRDNMLNIVGGHLITASGYGHLPIIKLLQRYLRANYDVSQFNHFIYISAKIAIIRRRILCADFLMECLKQSKPMNYKDLDALCITSLKLESLPLIHKAYYLMRQLIKEQNVGDDFKMFERHCKHLLSTKTENDPLYILYYAIKFDLEHYVNLVLNSLPDINTSDITEKLPQFGISLWNLSQQHPGISSALVARFQLTERNFPKKLKEARSYREWYSKQKALTTIVDTSAQCSEEILDPCKFLDDIKEQINPFNEEKFTVRAEINKLIDDTAKEVAKRSPLLRFTPILVGSSKEGTRCFKPDEFDFILQCDEIAKFLEFKDDPIHVRCAKIKVAQSTNPPDSAKRFIESKHGYSYFKVRLFKKEMDKLVREALTHIMETTKSLHLTIDANFMATKKISCIQLVWRGEKYKDMLIKIDILPGFKHKSYKPRHFIAANDPHDYWVLCKQEKMCAWNNHRNVIAFSSVELGALTLLNRPFREGFKLAKAMRVANMISTLEREVLQNIHNIEDILTTYMLKTCLLRILMEVNDYEHFKFCPEQWALLIYKDLYYHVKFGELRSVFDITLDKLVFQDEKPFILRCIHPLDIAQGDKMACCFKRQSLLLLTERILGVLERYCYSRTINVNDVYCLANIIFFCPRRSYQLHLSASTKPLLQAVSVDLD